MAKVSFPPKRGNKNQSAKNPEGGYTSTGAGGIKNTLKIKNAGTKNGAAIPGQSFVQRLLGQNPSVDKTNNSL